MFEYKMLKLISRSIRGVSAVVELRSCFKLSILLVSIAKQLEIEKDKMIMKKYRRFIGLTVF